MWRRKRLAIYVTLLDDSTLAEWYVVSDTASGGSDLVLDGLCDASKVPLVLAESWSEVVWPRTGAPST